jgi:myo-inositol-1(or 4)-monophosphatase
MSYTTERLLLETACREAGAIARRYQSEGFQTFTKTKGDPFLTEADTAIDTYLRTTLLAARPEYGWLSEETEDDNSRLAKTKCWVVDPIDGTRDFVERTGNFAVSAALVDAGAPVAAVVYNPMKEHLVSASKGDGLFLNGAKVAAKAVPSFLDAECLVSVTETRKGKWAALDSRVRTRPVGSVAYKLALVAAGLSDMTASLAEKNLWDICAGHLLCEEAGCIFTDLSGRSVRYDAGYLRVNGVIAAPPALYDPLKSLVVKPV